VLVAGLTELQPNVLVRGLVPGEVVTVVAAVPTGSDAVRLVFRLAGGAVHEQLVHRLQESELSIELPGAVRPFDADGRQFRLVGQWQDELFDKFELEFSLLTNSSPATSKSPRAPSRLNPAGNVFGMATSTPWARDPHKKRQQDPLPDRSSTSEEHQLST
jgi:hypothetical protein